MSGHLLGYVMDAFVAVAKPPVSNVLPLSTELDGQLTDDPANWRALVVRILDRYVDPLLYRGDTPSSSGSVMKGLPSQWVPGAPGSAAIAWNTEARLRQVLADPADIALTLPVTNTLPNAKTDVLDYKLRSFQRPGQTLAALELYLDYVAGGRALAASVTATKSSAKRAVLDLVELEAFLVRYSSAVIAAADAGASLAEALALYRVEGDLVAPMSDAYLTERLPPLRERLDVRYLGLDTDAVRETLLRGLWSYPFRTLAPRALASSPSVLPSDGPARNLAEQQIKSFSLVLWMLVIGGLDIVAKTLFLPLPPISFREHVAKFSDEYRISLGLPSETAHRKAEFDAVFNDLKIAWPPDVNGRVIVVPNTPVLLVSFVLALCLLVYRRGHAHGGGPFIQPPPGLEYLAYNVQAERVTKEKDRFVHLLASAAVAAANSHAATFAPLRNRLAPLGLPTRLPLDPVEEDPKDHIAVFDKLTAAPTDFLGDATNSDLIADFILRAEHADWSAYEANRGNLARYRKVFAFYKVLLS